jgi:hypothetical protein
MLRPRRETLIQILGKPPSFSRRVIAPESCGRCAPERSPRARGTPGVQRTHGLKPLAKREQTPIPAGSDISILAVPQVRFLSSVPRTVFEAFLRMAPGG